MTDPLGTVPRGLLLGTFLGKVACVRYSPDDQVAAVCAGNKVLVLDVEVRVTRVKVGGTLLEGPGGR